LLYVSLCLRHSAEAAAELRSGVTCVLQESNGRDLCCVVSSLTQLLLDPHFRSLDGFQSLIQKEWIALEHPLQEFSTLKIRLPAAGFQAERRQ